MNNLYITGDIERDLKTLAWKLVEKEKIRDADVIVLGNLAGGIKKDAGIENLYYRVRKRLEKNNITLWALRGDKDNPRFFEEEFELPRLKFLKDHRKIEVGDYVVYPIGGRVKESDKTGVEKIDIPKLPIKVDIILSAQSPLSMKPHLERPPEMTYELWKNILDERTYLSQALQEIRSGYWFCGDSQEPYRSEFGETIYRSLDKLEIISI